MILWLLNGLWIFVVNTIIDGSIYMLVDYFVKSAINNASCEEEKGVIWLGECILLLVVSLLIYVTSHTPYLLLVMVALTLAFTQIWGRVNLVYWWYQLLSRWDEFKLHEQSMEDMSRRRVQVPTQQPGPAPLRNIPLSTDPPDYPRPFHVSPRKPIRSDGQPEGLYQRYQHQPLLKQPQHQQPMRSQQQQQYRDPPQQPPPKIMVSQASSLTQKLKSVLGVGNRIPAGLRNNGENLCFLNSILQCIARSPGLVSGVDKGGERSGCSVAESELVKATKVLLRQLLNPSDYRLFNVADTSSFRKAASELQSMIAPPVKNKGENGEYSGPVQKQQDAAELLMWLLDTMQDSMNKAPTRIDPDAALNLSELSPQSLSTWSHLERELQPCTLTKINLLKNKYLREIEISAGVDQTPEAMQRLADLEWIQHRLLYRSPWTDTFSGQLVECQHCLACSRLSVGIQTFTVLPVPIVEARQASGFVYLEDCFSKYVNTENLFGKEGLCCPCSNPSRRTNSVSAAPTTAPKTPARSRIASTDSAVHSPSIGQSGFMSPIPSVGGMSLNDSGFPEQFRTSTPIAEGPILTNGQRRALLRQLPKCLVIQLMRFRYNPRFHDQYKIHTPVHIPLRGLSLSSMIFDDNATEERYLYDLYAMCLHLGAGTTNVGHYVSYCVDANENWWKLDDEDVSQVNMDFELNSRIVRENTYILFYRRRES